jgi:prepilin-type N-terminal cleavage/methylation domain-containing protein
MNYKKTGFTLIELMVTLAILAALTTVALRMASSIQTQGFYKQSTQQLNNIQSAILGPPRPIAFTGSGLISGFVADTGRLPLYEVSTSDPLTQLSPPQPGDPLTELTSNPNNIPAYSLQTSNVDVNVKVGVGWQGPYISVGAGPTFIRDGWGNSLLAFDLNGNQITTNGTPIAQIESTVNGAALNSSAVNLPYPTIGNNGGFIYQVSIAGQVTMNIGTDAVNGNPLTTGTQPNLTFSGTVAAPITSPVTTVTSEPVSIWVAYFGPDLTQTPNPVGTDPLLVNYNTAGVTGTANSGAWDTPWTGQFPNSQISNPTYSNITIGPRVLKVYVLPYSVQTVSQFNACVNAPTTITPIYATTTLNVTLVPGTQTIDLALPHYSP